MDLTYPRHNLEQKGFLHGAERLAQVFSRFSQGHRRFSQMISDLERNLINQDIRITFSVSSLLKRNRDLIERLQGLGHEIAAHGYYHSGMTNFSKDQQVDILERTHRTFGDCGLSLFKHEA